MSNADKKTEDLSAQKLELLQLRLRQRGIHVSKRQGISPRKATGPCPLSFAQQRLWLLDQLEPNTSTYNISASLQIEGTLNSQSLEKSLQEIVRRHESLRTTFQLKDDQPLQVIAMSGNFDLPLFDLRQLASEQREVELHDLIGQEARRPFDLGCGPLLRAMLLMIGKDEHVLLLTVHHIVADGQSIDVFVQEVTALYNAFVRGQSSPLPPLFIQYADFALWQRQWLQGEILEEQVRYWRKQLAGLVPLELGTDYLRPAQQTFRGAHQDFLLPRSLHEELKVLSQRENVTLFMTLLAAFQTLLARYTGQSDIALGTDVANRGRSELEGLIGFFVNTLVLRSDLSSDPFFLDLLQQVREVALGAYAHQDVPFEKLVEVLQPQRDLSRSPLFQVFLSVQQATSSSNMQGLTLRPLQQESGVAKFDLGLTMTETEQGLSCVMEYNIDLFQASTITRLLQHFYTLLVGIVRQPYQRISRLPLLSAEERSQILFQWNPRAVPFPPYYSLLTFFQEQVACTPDRVAVSYLQEQLTYAQLQQQVQRLAFLLRQQGVGTETLVGLYLPRTLDMLVSILAIFQAGGAYVPLDPAYPRERLEWILSDAQMPVILTTHALRPTLPVPDTSLLCLEECWAAMLPCEEQAPFPSVVQEQLAYVIYTSGSTGRPKGVMVQQKGMLNHLFAKRDALQLSEGDIIAQTASHCFDISVWQFLSGLLTGSRVHILSDELAQDPWPLWQEIAREGISILELVPSQLRQLLDTLQGSSLPLALRWLLVTGEEFSTALAERWLARFPQIPLLNAYGPTECSDDVTHACVRHLPSFQHSSIPIGYPIDNLQVYVLDAQLVPVPPGVSGQIYVGGVGVGRGYLRDVVRTAAFFVPDPYGEQAGGRLYQTGDLGVYQESGQIRFLGRVDEQVKVRGYRIELGEIKALLASHPQIGVCEVIAWERSAGDQRLVAYIVSQDQRILSATALRSYLRGKLPDYMLPSFFVMLETLPLTPNGKVDRRALPIPDSEGEESGGSNETRNEVLSPIEEIVASVWKEVLGREQIRRQDDFFVLGGHSLLATRVVARLRGLFGLDVPLRNLFEMPTVAGFSAQIERRLRQREEAEVPPLLAVSRHQALPLSFAQQRLWFLDQLESENTAYNVPAAMRLRGQLDAEALYKSLQEVVRRHESLRTTFQVIADQPQQIIVIDQKVDIPVVDLRILSPEQREEEASRLVYQEAGRPFDLARGPLIRIMLLHLGREEHVLLLTLHHIICDGWSIDVIVRELTTLYTTFAAGQSSPLPPLPIQYADFAIWQRQWLEGAIQEEQTHYWREQLAGLTSLDLPIDHPRTSRQTFRGALQEIHLPLSLHQELLVLSQQENVTLFMLLLAAFQVLLARYSAQDDISVGTAVANRVQPELEGLIGFFINMLVLRTDLSGNPTFRELLIRVREVALGAYAHQDIPFEQLVEELQPERNLGRPPFFQVTFSVQWASPIVLELGGLSISELSIERQTAKFDLSLAVIETAQDLRCQIVYNTDLFEATTIQRFLEHWQVLLHSIVADPHTPWRSLPVFSQSERQRMLVEWNGTRVPLTNPQTLPALFEDQVARTPDAIALLTPEAALSYAALHLWANRLAAFLHARGLRSHQVVALCMERSLEGAIALLGLLKAGAVYVPLDPTFPAERLALLLTETQATVLLTQQSMQGRFPTWGGQVVVLEEIWQDLAPVYSEPLEGDDLAYIFYTSGSTGQPKGVMVPHRAIVNRLSWGSMALNLQPLDRVGQLASWSFDIALWELFGPWMVGATVVIITAQQIKDSQALVQAIVHEQLTIIHLVPSLLAIVVHESGFSDCHSLRWLLCGGEAVRLELVRQAQTALAVRVQQYYGPTEAAISVTSWTAFPESPPQSISIGRPITNAQIYLLDGRGEPVPQGVRGEIYIGGEGLAWGYLQKPEQTAERFVPDSLSGQVGARLYRSGDVGRYRANGEIEFGGRNDTQVKIRGHRIEPAEIETVLRRHEAVYDCLVLVREDISGEPCLVAYAIGIQTVTPPTPKQLRVYLQECLPDYMIPSHVVVLDAWPLLSTGKVDQRALPDPERLAEGEEGEQAEIFSPLEELLAQLWCEVLGCSHVSREDDFFMLGGHSLLATRLISHIRVRLNVEVPVQSFFEDSTLSGLASQIEQLLRGGQENTIPPLVPQIRPAVLPLSFAQQRLWFMDQLLASSANYNMPTAVRLQGKIHISILERSLQEVVQRHEILRTTFQVRAGQPAQVIAAVQEVAIPVVDLRTLDISERQAIEGSLRQQEVQRPFDLASGPLLRSLLLRSREDEHVLLLTMHHIISDGRSMDVLVHEVTALYHIFMTSQPTFLPPLPIQYADFAIWQRSWLKGAALEAQLAYWRKHLAGLVPLRLPTDRPYSGVPGSHAAVQPLALQEDLSSSLIALGYQEGVTLFMMWLATFQAFLCRYCKQDDIVVGTDVANRNRAETDGLIGFFVNQLVLRSNLAGNPTFRSILKLVRQVALEAYAHQDVPFDKIVEELRPERRSQTMPLFQVKLSLQDTTQETRASSLVRALPGVTVVPLPESNDDLKLDLMLDISRTSQGMSGALIYNPALFDVGTMERMAQQYVQFLRSICANPDNQLQTFDILSLEEKEHQLMQRKEQEASAFTKLKAMKPQPIDVAKFKKSVQG